MKFILSHETNQMFRNLTPDNIHVYGTFITELWMFSGVNVCKQCQYCIFNIQRQGLDLVFTQHSLILTSINTKSTSSTSYSLTIKAM